MRTQQRKAAAEKIVLYTEQRHQIKIALRGHETTRLNWIANNLSEIQARLGK